MGRSARVDDLVDSVLSAVDAGDLEFLKSLSHNELALVRRIIGEMKDKGKSNTLDLLWSLDYEEKPVSIQRFLDDKYYLGNIGEVVRPKWREELEKVFAPESRVFEWVMTGAIGSGKTYIAVLSQVYMLYRLSCLRNPQRFYGLGPGSLIAVGLYNVHKYKVETTSFQYMSEMIASSPYFNERFRRDPNRKTAIIFPKNIYVISGSTELHAIGENLFSVLIDEAAFMKLGADELGQAHRLHTSTIRRIESRFMRLGRVPGFVNLVSSKQYESDYVQSFIKRNLNNPQVYISDFPLWDVLPKENYSGKYFRVAVGDAYQRSRILRKGEPVPKSVSGEPLRVVKVPIEHKRPFVEDVEAALRDIAGVATYGTQSFVPNRPRVFECVVEREDLRHPFNKDDVVLDINDSTTLADYLDKSALFRVVRSKLTPAYRPEAPRFLHVDLAVTQDCVGMAMGCQDGWKEVRREHADGSAYEVRVPVIRLDFMLRIRPPKGSEIDISKITDFIVMLREYGFDFGCVSFDGWQSVSSVQELKKQGIPTMTVSVDRTISPYAYLKQALMERRVYMYHYEPFLSEILNVQHDLKRGKVDHSKTMTTIDGRLVRGSKDVSDAVAAVVTHIMEGKVSSTDSAPVEQERTRVGRPNFESTELEGLDWVIGDAATSRRIRAIRAK